MDFFADFASFDFISFIKNNTIYIKYILFVVFIYFFSFLLHRAVNRFFYNKIHNNKLINQKINTFLILKNIAIFVIYFIATIILFFKIPFFKSVGTALFAGAGIITAAIGFASQKSLSNIISGFFIMVTSPFRINDVVELSNGLKGIVEDISLNYTVIRDFENKRILIPNSTISELTIVNYSIYDEKIVKHLEIDISYGSDISKAMEIIRNIVSSHPKYLYYGNKDKVEIKVMELGEYYIRLRVFVDTKDYFDAFDISSDLRKQIKEAFDREGVEIPFPYRNIIMKS